MNRSSNCRSVKPLAVPDQHPHVGEQVGAEVNGLGALQVRVARQRPVEVSLGHVRQRRCQPPDPRQLREGHGQRFDSEELRPAMQPGIVVNPDLDYAATG